MMTVPRQKVLFLGGTTGNDYREKITTLLLEAGVASRQIYNPVVEHWNEAAQQQEDAMKSDPSVLMLFYLGAHTDGSFLSFYSLHEATMGLYDDPDRTMVVFDYTNMVPRAAKRLKKVYNDLKKRFPEAPLVESVEDAATMLLSVLLRHNAPNVAT
jgi:hypothetical protein